MEKTLYQILNKKPTSHSRENVRRLPNFYLKSFENVGWENLKNTKFQVTNFTGVSYFIPANEEFTQEFLILLESAPFEVIFQCSDTSLPRTEYNSFDSELVQTLYNIKSTKKTKKFHQRLRLSYFEIKFNYFKCCEIVLSKIPNCSSLHLMNRYEKIEILSSFWRMSIISIRSRRNV